MPKFLFLSLVILIFTACTSNLYVGQNTKNFQRLSCSIKTDVCRINYTNDGYIEYSVKEVSDNMYEVSGNVDLNMNVVGGMYPKLSFYIIFMDNESVVFEKRVRTGTRKATFDFEVTTPKPITETSIEKMLFHTWS